MDVERGQILLGALLLCLGTSYGTKITCKYPTPSTKTVYGFNETDINGTKTIPLSCFSGQVLAIMNVASF